MSVSDVYIECGFGCVLCPLLSRWPQCTLGYIVYSAHLAEKVFQVQPKAALGNMLRQPCMTNPLPVHHHQWAKFQPGKVQIQSVHKENRIGGKYND